MYSNLRFNLIAMRSTEAAKGHFQRALMEHGKPQQSNKISKKGLPKFPLHGTTDAGPTGSTLS